MNDLAATRRVRVQALSVAALGVAIAGFFATFVAGPRVHQVGARYLLGVLSDATVSLPALAGIVTLLSFSWLAAPRVAVSAARGWPRLVGLLFGVSGLVLAVFTALLAQLGQIFAATAMPQDVLWPPIVLALGAIPAAVLGLIFVQWTLGASGGISRALRWSVLLAAVAVLAGLLNETWVDRNEVCGTPAQSQFAPVRGFPFGWLSVGDDPCDDVEQRKRVLWTRLAAISLGTWIPALGVSLAVLLPRRHGIPAQSSDLSYP